MDNTKTISKTLYCGLLLLVVLFVFKVDFFDSEIQPFSATSVGVINDIKNDNPVVSVIKEVPLDNHDGQVSNQYPSSILDLIDANEAFENYEITQDSLMHVNQLRGAFRDSIGDFEFHANLVKSFLESKFSHTDKINEFMAFYGNYQTYLDAQNGKIDAPFRSNSNTLDGAIQNVVAERKYVTDLFGEQTASKLWLQESLQGEYRLKTNLVLSNDLFDSNQTLSELYAILESVRSNGYIEIQSIEEEVLNTIGHYEERIHIESLSEPEREAYYQSKEKPISLINEITI